MQTKICGRGLAIRTQESFVSWTDYHVSIMYVILKKISSKTNFNSLQNLQILYVEFTKIQ